MLKRITAMLLAALLIVQILPPVQVLADAQAPVTQLRIVDNISPIAGTTYNILLDWDPPNQPSGMPDTSGVHPDYVGAPHQTEYYDIMRRNSTNPVAGWIEAAPGALGVPATSGVQNFMLNGLNLTPSSIYSFQVIPWHQHLYWQPLPDHPAGGIWTYRRAQGTPGFAAQLAEVLYLSDIALSAQGHGESITAAWNNPVYLGQDVFWGFQLSFRSAAAAPTVPWTNIPPIAMDDPGLSRGANNSMQFTFSHPNLVVGQHYSIRIEPLILIGGNPMELRNAPAAAQNVTVGTAPNTRVLPIRFTHPDREYRADGVFLPLQLNVNALGSAHVLLTWNRLAEASFASDIARVEVFSAGSAEELAQGGGTLIHILHGNTARNENFHLLARPSNITYFQIRVVDGNGNIIMDSTIETFNPLFVDFEPYSPTIRHPITNNAPTQPLSMNLYFRALTRAEFEQELVPLEFWPEVGAYLDRNLVYDFWVTDRLENLSDPNFIANGVVAEISAAALPVTLFSEPDNIELGHPALFFNTNLTQFRRMENGAISAPTALADNEVYYIRIRARRIGGVDRPSYHPAYGSHYIPPIGPLFLRPQAMQAPPLRVGEVETNSFEIQWTMAWAESFDSSTNSWSALVGVNDDGDIVYASAAAATGNPIRLYEPEWHFNADTQTQRLNQLAAQLAARGASDSMQLDTLVLRMVELPANTQFEIHVVEYDHMTQNGGSYEDYLNTINAEGFTNWSAVTGFDTANPSFNVTQANAPSGAIQPNTAYVAFFRPLVTAGDGRLVSWWPAFVSATTGNELPGLVVTPTTPRLEVVREMTTDTSITVRWNHSPPFGYELRWSELATDYPGGGVLINQAAIETNSFTRPESPGYLYYTVSGLFPNTLHYFWIRAASGPNFSAWSNPVDERTLDIQPPAAPSGLGLVSNYHIDAFNRENGVNLSQIGHTGEGEDRVDYMIIEWMRITADMFNLTPPATPGTTASTFAGETGITGEWLQSATFTQTRVAQFLNLRPNTRYYFRAQTVLTVTRNSAAGAGITRWYSYRVHVSETPDFIDFFEIIIPALNPAENQVDNVNSLRRVSEWSEIVAFASGISDEEYDGLNPEMFPLPSQDFEITYDPATQTLRYRFRSNQVGADGLRDNQVDQRFISRLVANRVFNFEIDLTHYRGYPISHRIVEMPYSIFEAFEHRQIDLSIISAQTTFTLTHGALATAEVSALPDFGRQAYVTISIAVDPADTPYLAHNQAYSAHPQRLTIAVSTPSRNLNITNFARDINVVMRAADMADALVNNVNVFVSHMDTGGWQLIPSSHNDVNASFTTNAYRAATFALISSAAPMTIEAAQGLPYSAESFSDALYIVNSALLISDMLVFEPEVRITSDQFNNIIYAYMTGRRIVEKNANTTAAQRRSLERGGVLTSGPAITNQQAIGVMVRLYEVRTRRPVRGHASVATSPISDIQAASPQFREAILKAAHIGMIEGFRANPQQDLTMGEFMHMLAIVIEDAGL